MQKRATILILKSFVFFLLVSSGCFKISSGPEVIVYSALDREFSEPILRQFEQESGIRVRAVYDTESTKTVGLTTRLIAESRRRTRCDVFWNNEILNTMRLDELGTLEAYRPKEGEAFPPTFRSSEDRWFGFAARARVLLVNTDIVANADMPTSIYDLHDAKWKGKVGIAKPLFGTTATHAACLFEALGEENAKEFFQGMKNNDVQVLSGNKQVAEDVAAGKIAFGLTDTDDAIIEVEAGHKVAIVYPDSSEGQIGTLFIPNTLSLQRGAPHLPQAKKLMDFLLRAEVEKKLAQGESAQIPLHPDVQIDLRVATPQTVLPMAVDFEKAAKQWDLVGEYLQNHFANAVLGNVK